MRLGMTNKQIKWLADVSQGRQYCTQRRFFEDGRSGLESGIVGCLALDPATGRLIRDRSES